MIMFNGSVRHLKVFEKTIFETFLGTVDFREKLSDMFFSELDHSQEQLTKNFKTISDSFNELHCKKLADYGTGPQHCKRHY